MAIPKSHSENSTNEVIIFLIQRDLDYLEFWTKQYLLVFNIYFKVNNHVFVQVKGKLYRVVKFHYIYLIYTSITV